MIKSVSRDSVSRLVTDRSMCFATALDKAFENIDCMIAILSCQTKNRFYESTQRLIQPRRVLWRLPIGKPKTAGCLMGHVGDRELAKESDYLIRTCGDEDFAERVPAVAPEH